MLQKFFPKNRILPIAVLSAVLTLLIVFGYEIDHFDSLSFRPITAAATVGTFVLCAFVLAALYVLMDKVNLKGNCTISRKKAFLISFLILIVLYIVFLLGVFPGLFNFDAQAQYNRYRLNLISEHHPVLHTVILGFLVTRFSESVTDIQKGVFVYSIVQVFLSAMAFSYAVSYVYSKLKNKIALYGMILFFGIYPPIVLQVLSATKDSYFLIFFMISVTLVLEFFENEKAFLSRIWKPVILTLSVVLMTIFRNNCMYAIPVLWILMLVKSKKETKKYAAVMTGAFLGLFVLYKVLFVPAFVTEKVNGREFYSVPIQQIMRVYTSDDSVISDSQREIVEKLFAEEGREYYPAIADVPKAYIDMDYYKGHKKEVQQMYLDVIRQNPKDAIEAFLAVNCGMWYPGCDLTLYPEGIKGYWPIECLEPARLEPVIPMISDFFAGFEEKYFSTQKVIFPYLFAPGSFFVLFLAMLLYATEKKKKGFVVAGIFVFVYWLTFLLGPVALVRYAMFLFALLPFYLLLPAGNKETVEENKETE